MRYLMSLILGCVSILGIATSVAWAGLEEDCAQNQNPDLAIRACSDLIRRNPSDAIAHSNRAAAYADKGAHDRAIADLDEAIRLSPRDARVYANRGATYSLKGDYDRAITDYNEAIRLNPRHAFAYVQRGNAYGLKGDYDHAIADYTAATALNPGLAIAYGGRGSAHSLKGDYDRAIADFSEVLRVDPRDALAYGMRGRAYTGKGDYSRAILDLNEAIKLNPRVAGHYFNRAQAYLLKGNFDHAIADFNECIRLDSSIIIAFSLRGKTFEAKGNRAKATEDYTRALSIPAKTQQDRDEQEEARRRLATLQFAPPKAAPTAADPPAATSLGRRVALVIGNASYKVGPLANPVNDAAAVAEALEKQLKFDKVTLKLDLGRESFRAALSSFSREAAGAGLALVYYAGHATERRGKNFLIPIDARLDKASDLGVETVLLETVLEQIEGATKLKLVILDACRNNMFPLADGDRRGGSRGLIRVEPGRNTLVAYAAKDGTVAADGVGRKHSPFTDALLKRIATPGLELRFLFGHVRDDVLAATAHRKEPQEPYLYGSLGGEQIFLRP